MNTEKSPKRRKAGALVYAKQRPKLELIKPGSECATTDLITELSQEVKVMLGKTNRHQQKASEDNTPEAA